MDVANKISQDTFEDSFEMDGDLSPSSWLQDPWFAGLVDEYTATINDSFFDPLSALDDDNDLPPSLRFDSQPVAEHGGDNLFQKDEGDSQSLTTEELCDILDFESKYSPEQTLESEDIPNNPISQSLELEGLPNQSNVQQFQTSSPAPPNKRSAFSNQGTSRKGCQCLKSECSNGYCPCHKAKAGCSDLCRCKSCKNNYGSKDGGSASTSYSSAAAYGSLSPNVFVVPSNIPRQPAAIQTPPVVGQPHQNQPFPPSCNISQQQVGIQMATIMAQPQPPKEILPPLAGPMAATMAQPQVNPFGASTPYHPQQQHTHLFNPINPFAGVSAMDRVLRTSLNKLPRRFRQDALQH